MRNILKIAAILMIPVMIFVGCGKDADLGKVAEKFVEKAVDDFVNNVEVEDGCVTTILVGKKVKYCDPRLASVDKLLSENFTVEDANEE